MGFFSKKIGGKEETVRFVPHKLGIKPNSIIGQSKKRYLSIILWISKFQDDILNQKFFICIDWKSTK